MMNIINGTGVYATRDGRDVYIFEVNSVGAGHGYLLSQFGRPTHLWMKTGHYQLRGDDPLDLVRKISEAALAHGPRAKLAEEGEMAAWQMAREAAREAMLKAGGAWAPKGQA